MIDIHVANVHMIDSIQLENMEICIFFISKNVQKSYFEGIETLTAWPRDETCCLLKTLNGVRRSVHISGFCFGWFE